LQNIHFNVPGRQLLSDVSCNIRSGALTAVMGANGAGKSTLLKAVSGEIKISGGQILWNKQHMDTYDPKELSKKRSFLRQNYALQLPFTAYEIVEMGRYPYFHSRATARCRQVIEETSTYVGIQHLLKRNYLTLSGGEQQRVQLARVLAQVWDAPEGQRLVMLDEPVSALDIHYQHQLLGLVYDLAHHKGYTVLAILHDINLAFQYADDVLLLKDGHKVAFGAQNDVFSEETILETFGVSVSLHQPPGYAHRYITVDGRRLATTTHFMQEHNNYSFK